VVAPVAPREVEDGRRKVGNAYLCIFVCSENKVAVHREKQAPHEKI
jgi:hypothetical protein